MSDQPKSVKFRAPRDRRATFQELRAKSKSALLPLGARNLSVFGQKCQISESRNERSAKKCQISGSQEQESYFSGATVVFLKMVQIILANLGSKNARFRHFW